jgi:hypothetical protein
VCSPVQRTRRKSALCSATVAMVKCSMDLVLLLGAGGRGCRRSIPSQEHRRPARDPR